MFGKKDNVDVGASKYDVDDREKYAPLEPVWEVLEKIPSDIQISSKELWEQSSVDPEVGNPLIKELFKEFQQKMLGNMLDLALHPDHIVDSWVFDKMMLLSTRVNTGSGVELGDSPVMSLWKDKWMKKRGF